MKRFKSIAVAAFTVFVAVGLFVPVLNASAEGSASLSIAPKKTYLVEPGKTVDDTLNIRNLDTLQPLELSLRVVDFTYTDNGGTPKLNLDTDAPETTWSLRSFLKVPKTVTIEPGSSKIVPISVTIPAGHGAGSYYSAIVYSTGAPEEGGNVGLSASGVTLVFTTIPGKVTEDLGLKKLGLYDNAVKDGSLKGYKIVTEKEPMTIGYTLENKGNVTEAPVGSITLKDFFGNETVIDDVNPNGSLALIGQTRTYTTCIKKASQNVDFQGSKALGTSCVNPGLWPGYYSVSLDLFYGQNGNNTQEITGKGFFWYLPWWFVIAVIIILLVAAFFIWRLVKKIREAMYGPRFKKSSLRRRR